MFIDTCVCVCESVTEGTSCHCRNMARGITPHTSISTQSSQPCRESSPQPTPNPHHQPLCSPSSCSIYRTCWKHTQIEMAVLPPTPTTTPPPRTPQHTGKVFVFMLFGGLQRNGMETFRALPFRETLCFLSVKDVMSSLSAFHPKIAWGFHGCLVVWLLSGIQLPPRTSTALKLPLGSLTAVSHPPR